MKAFPALWLVMSVSLFAQNLLPEQWKFQVGDDPAWASVDYSDSDWGTVKAGELWESQGFPSYDGYAWYRVHFVVPSALKSKAEKYGGLVLRLAKIDDADETFFNGKLIGRTGQMPPDYLGRYDALRNYSIPSELIRWDQPNVIAVRVYDHGGGGGIYGGAPALTVKGLLDLITVKPKLGPQDHILLNVKTILVPVELSNDADENISGVLSLEVVSDFKKPVFKATQPIKLKAKSSRRTEFKLSTPQPGFYVAVLSLGSPIVTISHRFAFGVDPERIVSPTDARADFSDYWARAKRELAAVDPQYKLTRIDSLCSDKREVFLVEMRSLGNILIRGWYARPTAPGRYPAILHVQGYSTNMQPAWIYRGDDMVAFGLNIRGHGNSRDNVDPGFPGYLLHQLADKETYIYRGAYMDCIRAVDFLVSRPEVDASRIAVEGGSQGGALSFATAALDRDRIAACAPDVPFLSDFQDYFQVAAWPGNEFYSWVEKNPQIGWDKVYETLSYIDIKNLAPWIKAPVRMAVGLLDETCPPHINFAAYNQVTSPKSYAVYPYSGHNLPPSNWQAKMDWIKTQLGVK
ncbi:MAG: acetylxylan esterase [candidate division KSB1 bacterium]|nr:acetylxylan esterase [candidate division KSB1 bacterium]